MSNPNGDGADVNRPVPSASAIHAKFDPAAVTVFWMSSSARMVRSSEILMRGMTEVARLEAALGQQYVQRSLSALQTPVFRAKPEVARAKIDDAMQNVDGLMATMRQIVEQFRHTIQESTQALFDMPAPAPEQSLAASIHIEDPVARLKPAQPAAAKPVTD